MIARANNLEEGDYMDHDEAEALIPEMLGMLYEGKYRPATDAALFPEYPGGWLLEDDGALAFLKVSRTRKPFVWMRIGAAIEIPTSSELAFYVACANKDLVAGRAYLRYGEPHAFVAVDESVFTETISRVYPPTMQEVVTRLDFALEHARDLQWWILEKFGGRPFSNDDWYLLAPDLEGTALEKRPTARAS
ncbi:MAG TPA: hypothetical protein VK721_15375 [Solirubrobacteraceae bacterium]|jgi:hypothetical protein|nr:hypothetical protein [Solirubrobacteraceae bacterium]